LYNTDICGTFIFITSKSKPNNKFYLILNFVKSERKTPWYIVNLILELTLFSSLGFNSLSTRRVRGLAMATYVSCQRLWSTRIAVCRDLEAINGFPGTRGIFLASTAGSQHTGWNNWGAARDRVSWDRSRAPGGSRLRKSSTKRACLAAASVSCEDETDSERAIGAVIETAGGSSRHFGASGSRTRVSRVKIGKDVHLGSYEVIVTETVLSSGTGGSDPTWTYCKSRTRFLRLETGVAAIDVTRGS